MVKRSKRLGLVILMIVVFTFAMDLAVKSSSRAIPPNSVSLRQSFVGLYRGDLGFWVTGDPVTTAKPHVKTNFSQPLVGLAASLLPILAKQEAGI